MKKRKVRGQRPIVSPFSPLFPLLDLFPPPSAEVNRKFPPLFPPFFPEKNFPFPPPTSNERNEISSFLVCSSFSGKEGISTIPLAPPFLSLEVVDTKSPSRLLSGEKEKGDSHF